MAEPLQPAPCNVDPRIRRTREHLQQALAKLLLTQDFERVSVQEVTDAAGVNRATFYAHYPDKFALLECMVATRFHALLESRGVVFNGGCTHALRGLVLGVCDFLAQNLAQPKGTPSEAASPGSSEAAVPGSSEPHGRPLQPHMETAIIAVVRNMVLAGLAEHGTAETTAGNNLRASAISWAIYGAAREWASTPDRAPSEEIATTVVTLVAPLLNIPEQETR